MRALWYLAGRVDGLGADGFEVLVRRSNQGSAGAGPLGRRPVKDSLLVEPVAYPWGKSLQGTSATS